MTHRLIVTTVAWLSLVSAARAAVDYGGIDRALVQEPDYRTDMPQYALLLFGPRAELRVWTVLDGETLYLDRNADGDLTAPDERFATLDDCRDVTIGQGAATPYVINHVAVFELARDDTPERLLHVNVRIAGAVAYRQYCGVRIRSAPAVSHLAHFDGPLRIYPGSDDGRPGPEHVLRIGERVELDAVIGTIDAGVGCWTAVEVERGGQIAFPAGVFPHVDVEFPARDGGPPLRRTYPLSSYC